MASIMEQIRKWKHDDHVSYRELAKRTGWTYQNIWMKLNRCIYPNFDTVRRIVEAMGREIIAEPMDVPPAVVELTDLYAVVEEQNVSFDVVEAIFKSIGYEIHFRKTQ